jgi:protein TonB
VFATLAASATLHVTAAALVRHDSRAPVVVLPSARTIPVSFDGPLTAEPAPAPVAPEPEAAPQSHPAAHVAASPHTAIASPHTAVTSNEPATTETPTSAVPASTAPVHFVMSSAITVAGSTTVASAGTARPSGGGGSGDAVVPESRVTVPARLIARAPVSYPPAARAAEIETDVRVELVLDTSGHVVAARSVRSVGYGLDEAAVAAVRSYRFSPALLDGRPVSVRMLWTVQFRLN